MYRGFRRPPWQAVVTCADSFYPTSDTSVLDFLPQVTATCGANGWEVEGYCAPRLPYCSNDPSVLAASNWYLSDTVDPDNVWSGTPCTQNTAFYGTSCTATICTYGGVRYDMPGVTATCTPPTLQSQWQPYWATSGYCFISKWACGGRWALKNCSTNPA